MNRSRLHKPHGGWLAASVLAAGLLLSLSQAGCAPYRVVMPVMVAQPSTTVWLVDYGRHSSLLLPRKDGTLVEYSYGEWQWYAQNQDQAYRAPLILLIGGQGALGRREFAAEVTTETFSHSVGYEARWPMVVSVERWQQVLSELDQQFEQQRHTITINHAFDPALELVKHPLAYNVFYTCNHWTAHRLRELGVSVKGANPNSLWQVTIESPE